jgi:hypothetical protein
MAKQRQVVGANKKTGRDVGFFVRSNSLSANISVMILFGM